MSIHHHKLNPEKKAKLLELRAQGEKLEYLAALFGVSRPTVEYHCYAKVRESRLQRARERRRAA